MVRRFDGTGTDETAGGQNPVGSEYTTTLCALSDRLVELSRPIRVLDAVKWGDEVEAAFFADGARALPRVTRDYYDRRPLSFDPQRQRDDFAALERAVQLRLGLQNAAGRMLIRRCREGRAAADLVARRGTPAFAALSAQLYGSAADCADACLPPMSLEPDPDEERTLSAANAAQVLSERLTDFFSPEAAVRVRLSDDIHADAAAGGDYIKVRHDACFTSREVRLLEVHEGWVHLATTLNGRAQPVCTFLTRGSPSATVTQEGLAVLTEVLTLASHPERTRRLRQRVDAVGLAEAGASFLDVYRFYCEEGCEPRAAYQHTTRVFRGSLPEKCGPFTKDLAYCRGFAQVTNFVRAALASENADAIPLLFCGKTCVADAADLLQLADEGLLQAPRYVPPPIADIRKLMQSLPRPDVSASPDRFAVAVS